MQGGRVSVDGEEREPARRSPSLSSIFSVSVAERRGEERRKLFVN